MIVALLPCTQTNLPLSFAAAGDRFNFFRVLLLLSSLLPDAARDRFGFSFCCSSPLLSTFLLDVEGDCVLPLLSSSLLDVAGDCVLPLL
jgi:hypothetical protein